MVLKHEQTGPNDDLGHLLQDAYAGPPLREEFVAMLGETLDAALDSDNYAERIAETNGQTPQTTVETSDGRDSLAIGSKRQAQPQRTRQHRARRWTVIGSAAAVLLLGLFLWSDGPSYSWASMVEALENQPWIESTDVPGGDGSDTDKKAVRWISIVRRVVASRANGQIEFENVGQGVRSSYQAGDDVVYRYRQNQPQDQGAVKNAVEDTEDFDQRLTSLLLGKVLADRRADEAASKLEMVRESWQEREDETGRWVELRVTFQMVGESRQQVEVVFGLDPETRLPRWCRVAGDDQPEPAKYRFEYPDEGPEDIFSLGVPANAKIVDRVDQRVANITMPDRLAVSPMSSADTPSAHRRGAMAAGRVADDGDSKEDDSGAIAAQTGEAEPEVPFEPGPALPTAKMSQRIDTLLAGYWQENGIQPAGPASDYEFLRRIYLDLTGRVPTINEIRTWAADNRLDRREALMDDLLGRRDHATHLAAVWRQFLLPDGADLQRYGGVGALDQWLSDQFSQGKPYDRVVRELLLAEGRVNESGPVLFYTALSLRPEEIAAQTSRAFLGMRIECAQCHDHPFDDWTQHDFWGYAAFFARISRPEGKMERVSPVLRVRDSRRGDVKLPKTEEIVGPRFLRSDALDEDRDSPSRRERLADWMTAPENRYFARATVNRVWSHLFGRGLVDPVDDMGDHNPPTYPQLLDELAEYFVATGFDLRRLLRTLTGTQAYQLTSRSEDDDPAQLLLFARMNIKSFTAEQLYDCICVATLREPLHSLGTSDSSLQRLGSVNRKAFLEEFHAPPGQITEYHAGIPQALTLINGRLIAGASDLSTSGLLRSLSAPFFDDEQRLETLFLATLSRPPRLDERETMLAYIDSAETQPQRQQALGDVLWALLNCAEFTVNH